MQILSHIATGRASENVATFGSRFFADADNGDMRLAIHRHRKAQGLTLEALAERAGISRSYLNELENGSKVANARRLQQIANALGIQVTDLIEQDHPTIAVAGQVGAGASVELVDAYAKGAGIFHVEAPAGVDPHNVVAVEVIGDSMVPIIQPGAVLLFTRHFEGVDPMDLGHVVICETDDGHVWVKQIRQGREPSTYDLHSARDGLDPIYGQRVRWAARMRHLIQPEDVHRIEDLGAG